MNAPGIEAANALAAVLAGLRERPTLLAEFGGDPMRFGGHNEAPYPRVVLEYGDAGSDLDSVWLLRPALVVKTFGALDGTPGQTELRRLHYLVLGAINALPAEQHLTGDRAVIVGVSVTGSTRPRAEPLTYQPYWQSTRLFTVHPPTT